jgi:hypothetical protein
MFGKAEIRNVWRKQKCLGKHKSKMFGENRNVWENINQKCLEKTEIRNV